MSEDNFSQQIVTRGDGQEVVGYVVTATGAERRLEEHQVTDIDGTPLHRGDSLSVPADDLLLIVLSDGSVRTVPAGSLENIDLAQLQALPLLESDIQELFQLLAQLEPQGIAHQLLLEALEARTGQQADTEQNDGSGDQFEALLTAARSGQDIDELLEAPEAGQPTASTESVQSPSLIGNDVGQVTPAAGIDTEASIATQTTLVSEPTADPDSTPPTLTISSSESEVAMGMTAVVIFAFSEPVEGFGLSDIQVSGGTLENLVRTDGQLWTAEFVPSPDSELRASISVEDDSYTDIAGNPGSGAGIELDVDTLPPEAMIVLDPITNDGIVNAAEAEASVTVTGTVGGDVVDGDTVTLTVNDSEYTGTVSGGAFSIDVAGSDLSADSDATIEASVTTSTGDVNGEATATDSESYGVNTDVPSASISLDENVTADDVISAAEESTNIAITGTVGGDVVDGDTVTLTVNDAAYTGVVSDGAFNIEVPGSELVADADLTIEASVTTSTGSPNGETTATATDSYSVATSVNDPPVAVDDTSSTDEDTALVLNESELLANDSDVDGDSLSITSVQDPVNGTVVLNGDGTITFTPEADYNGPASFTYTVSDGEGGTDTATVNLTVDAVNDPPSIDVVANDFTENSASTDDVAATFSTSDEEGDSLTVGWTSGSSPEDGSGNALYTLDAGSGQVLLTAAGADYVNGGNDLPAIDLTVDDGSATASDSDDPSVTLVNDAPTAIITLDENITADDVINATEAGQDIAITGTVGGDVADGDTVTLTVNGSEYTGRVSGGAFSIDVAGIDLAADGDTTIEASVTTTDAAGNSATATDSEGYSVHQSAAITVSLDDVNSANAADAPISGSTSDVEPGQTVTLTISDGSSEVSTTATVGGDGSYSTTADLSGLDDGTLEVSATVQDAAGNEASATDTAQLDTAADAGTVTVDDITSDDVINASEAGETITVTGTASGGDISENDPVAMTINGVDYDTTVDGSGTWSVEVDGADLAADTEFDVVVSSTDEAGNPVESTGSSTHSVDQSAAITVSLDDVNSANAADAPISGSTSDVEPGQTVTLTISDGSSEVSTTATVGGDGSYSTTADLSGLDDGTLEVSATVQDAAGNEASASDTAALDATAPTIDIDAVTGDNQVDDSEDESVTLSGTTTGAEQGETVSVAITDGSNSEVYDGTAQVGSDGSWSITDVDLSGLADGADYTVTADVSDAAGNAATQATEAFTMTANESPVAADDSYDTDEDTALTTGNVLNNDELGDEPSSIVAFDATSAQGGSVSYNNDGTFDYTPAADFNGSDTFTYTLEDADGEQSTATVTVNVDAVNDPPVAVDDTSSTDEDTALVLNESDLLANDSDVDGDSLSITSVQDAVNGTVVLNGDGTITFTPEGDYDGPASFTYTVSDGEGGTDTATVDVTVESSNDLPVAENDTITVLEDIPYEGDVSGNDTLSGDGGNVFSVQSGDGPSNGAVTMNADGTYVYTPDTDFSGSDSFTYTLEDTDGDVSTATVKITVEPLADAIPGTDASVVIGAPYENEVSFENSDGGLDGQTSYTFPNGVTLSTNDPAHPFTWSNGSLLGVQSGGGGDKRLDGDEAINIQFPSGMQYLSLKLKNASDDTPQITAVLEEGDLTSGTVSGQLTSSSGDPVNSSTLEVDLVLTLNDGSEQRIDAVVDGAGNWTADYSAYTGSIAGAEVVSYVDGDLFNQGGNTSANVSISMDTDMSSVSLGLDSQQRFSQGETNNGYQIEYLDYEASQDGSTTYTYPVDVYAAVQDTTGTDEEVTELLLSGFPDDSTLTVLNSDGTYDEIVPNADGEYDLSAYIDKLGTDTSGTGVDQIYLTAESELPADFAPTMEMTIDDQGNLAKTILGGSGDSVIDGSPGDDFLSGGAGADTFLWESGDERADYPTQDIVADFSQGEGDVLDISDLLVGETEASLGDYLDFNFGDSNGDGNTDTTIDVRTDGDGTPVNQQIILQGQDLSSLGSESDIITNLLNNNNLVVDNS